MTIVQYMLYAVIIHTSSALMTSAEDGYQNCTGLHFQFDGYTYLLDNKTGEKVWTHCSFPSPLADHERCGRAVRIGEYYLCDPDKLLDQTQAQDIERRLWMIRNRTSTMCTRSSGEKESFMVGIAIIDRIQIPQLYHPDVCMNECGQLQPLSTINDTYPDDDGKNEIMRLFAGGLRSLWQLGVCENDVIVLYCREFNMVYVSAGSRASIYLPKADVVKFQETFRKFIDIHGFHRGLELALLDLLSSLKVSLQGFTVAHIILTINALLAVVATIAILFYIFVKDSYMNVWGDEVKVIVWEWFIKLISGIALVQCVIMLIAAASHKGNGYGLYVALAIALVSLSGCGALYFISKDVESYVPRQ